MIKRIGKYVSRVFLAGCLASIFVMATLFIVNIFNIGRYYPIDYIISFGLGMGIFVMLGLTFVKVAEELFN